MIGGLFVHSYPSRRCMHRQKHLGNFNSSKLPQSSSELYTNTILELRLQSRFFCQELPIPLPCSKMRTKSHTTLENLSVHISKGYSQCRGYLVERYWGAKKSYPNGYYSHISTSEIEVNSQSPGVEEGRSRICVG